MDNKFIIFFYMFQFLIFHQSFDEKKDMYFMLALSAELLNVDS